MIINSYSIEFYLKKSCQSCHIGRKNLWFSKNLNFQKKIVIYIFSSLQMKVRLFFKDMFLLNCPKGQFSNFTSPCWGSDGYIMLVKRQLMIYRTLGADSTKAVLPRVARREKICDLTENILL